MHIIRKSSPALEMEDIMCQLQDHMVHYICMYLKPSIKFLRKNYHICISLYQSVIVTALYCEVLLAVLH